MKHLHVTQSIEPLRGGGLGFAVKDLHEAMLMDSIESKFLSTHSEPSSQEIKSGYLAKPVGGKRFFYSPELRQQVQFWENDFDTAHLHGFYVYPNWAVGGFARKHGKSLVCHPHGFFEPWILKRSKVLKSVVHQLFETANFRATKLWRALTEKEAGQIRNQGISAPIVVAANGIHLEQWDRTVPDTLPTKEKKRLLFLGRIHPKKGLPMLVDAWQSLPSERKDWELIIAGPDELGHKRELENKIRNYSLDEEIKFIGTVTGGEKKAWLESSDLFILPSYSEGFSIAILEGMAARLPVLATSQCNFPEISSEGGGWVCEPELDSLKKELAKALSSSATELTERGIAARGLIESRYTWSIIAKTIHEASEQYCG